MRLRLSKPFLLLVLGLVSSPSVASADLIWAWEFAAIHYTVDPDESIVVEASLINSPLSTESITAHGGASFTGDLQKLYTFSWGTTGIYGENLVDLDVAPGATFTFVLGTLTPIGGSVAAGVHPFCCQADLTFGTPTELTTQPPGNTFEIEVVDVAEPPLALLGAIGLVMTIIVGRMGRP
jgi:hypothetical protein